MSVKDSLLYPNIGGAPGGVPLTREPAQAKEPKNADGLGIQNTEAGAGANFQDILNANIGGNSIQNPLKFSAHANSRLQSRGIEVGTEQMRKLTEAVDKAAAKGLDDTLILTKDAAFIVSVKNRTVVTAMDRSQLEGNVFTNIEGAVII